MDDREVIQQALDKSVTTEISGFKPMPCGEITIHKDVDAFLAHLEASGRVIVPVEAVDASIRAANMIDLSEGVNFYALYRVMIAAAKGQANG